MLFKTMRSGCLIILGLLALLIIIGYMLRPQTTVAPSTVIQTPTPSRCLAVPAQLVQDIAEGLTVQGGGNLRTESAQAVKSNDYQNVYFIAADIQGTGMDGATDIGVWASNSLESGKGMIMAADAVAAEFSDWPKGSGAAAAISISADGAQESRDCVKAKIQ